MALNYCLSQTGGARLTEGLHAVKTPRLLPAAYYDTIQLLGFNMDAYSYAASKICMGAIVG
jgi:hypothetical protein